MGGLDNGILITSVGNGAGNSAVFNGTNAVISSNTITKAGGGGGSISINTRQDNSTMQLGQVINNAISGTRDINLASFQATTLSINSITGNSLDSGNRIFLEAQTAGGSVTITGAENIAALEAANNTITGNLCDTITSSPLTCTGT